MSPIGKPIAMFNNQDWVSNYNASIHAKSPPEKLPVTLNTEALCVLQQYVCSHFLLDTAREWPCLL